MCHVLELTWKEPLLVPLEGICRHSCKVHGMFWHAVKELHPMKAKGNSFGNSDTALFGGLGHIKNCMLFSSCKRWFQPFLGRETFNDSHKRVTYQKMMEGLRFDSRNYDCILSFKVTYQKAWQERSFLFPRYLC